MTQAQPTTQEIAEDAVGEIDSALGTTTPLLAKAFTRVIAKANAGQDVLLYKYASFILLQLFPSTATMRETTILGRVIRPLVEWGKLYGAGEPKGGERAQLVVAVSVQTQSGNLEANRQLIYPGTGVVYVVTASVALNASTVYATVRATSDQQGGDGTGSIGNLPPGAQLEFANPLPNIARTAVVTSQAVTGADPEVESGYRARVVRRAQRRAQGGAYADYQQWGEELAGVAGVYPYAGDPGTVVVYVEATPESSGSPDGIPTGAQLTAVKGLIEMTSGGLASRRPVGAYVIALPISRTAFDVVVTGMLVDDVAAAEDSIDQAIDEYLRAREPFIVGLSQLPRLDRVTQASISGIVDDVVSALGGSVASVALVQGGNPISAYTLGLGEKAKLGAVSYV